MTAKPKISKALCLAVMALCMLLLILFEIILEPRDTSPWKINGMIVSRLLASGIFGIVLLYLGYRVGGRTPGRTALLTFLVALIVAFDNFPWITMACGWASVTGGTGELLLLGCYCLSIGLFEELAFRGVLFLRLLENRRSSSKQIFWVTVLSSAAFGLIHLLNLLEGASPLSALLQIGYSFLIGGMCAIVLLKTGNLWLCVLIHAVYDFGGNLISMFGEGLLWDTPTVILTVAISLPAIAFMVLTLLRIRPEETDRFYKDA